MHKLTHFRWNPKKRNVNFGKKSRNKAHNYNSLILVYAVFSTIWINNWTCKWLLERKMPRIKFPVKSYWQFGAWYCKDLWSNWLWIAIRKSRRSLGQDNGRNGCCIFLSSTRWLGKQRVGIVWWINCVSKIFSWCCWFLFFLFSVDSGKRKKLLLVIVPIYFLREIHDNRQDNE